MSQDLVVITGGSRGIGAALVSAWPDPPARIVVLARSAPPPESHGIFVGVDLATIEGIGEAVEVIRSEVAATEPSSRVVLVHNAAGLDPLGFAGEVATSEVADQAVLNMVAPVALGNALLEAVARPPRPGRSIVVQITSGAARSVYPGWSGYGPAKAAVDHWVRHVGQEQGLLTMRDGRRPVDVVAVAPGVVATAMQEQIRAADDAEFPSVDRFRRLHRDGDLADPDDVARRLWALVLDGNWATGDVLDLRN